NESQ
ncbi:GTP cyclohydrolase 1, partial [Haemophilus influenzae]